jgi:hypothetical protein
VRLGATEPLQMGRLIAENGIYRFFSREGLVALSQQRYRVNLGSGISFRNMLWLA